MKKTIAISSLLLGVVFLAGCGQKPVSQTQQTTPASVAQETTTNQPTATPSENKVATNSACGQAKDDSGITYGAVLAEDGKCWLDRNLGATEVATSEADEASYGWYFQWGRGADGHQIPTSSTTATLSATDNPGHTNFIINSNDSPDWRNPQNDNLWQGASGINNPCPTGFRLPTQPEWDSLALAAKITDSDTAFNSSLKFSLAGSRGSDGTFDFQGFNSGYWSSSPYSVNINIFFFRPTGVYPIVANRASGFSVRCLKD